jgi:type IV secretory pathway VirB10-like protein
MLNETNEHEEGAGKNQALTLGTDGQEVPVSEATTEEEPSRNWREIFRTALDKARRQQKPVNGRQELGRDRTRSLFLLVGVSVALLLLFLGVFSSPKKRAPLPGENPRGRASLGRKITPGQENSDPTKAVTPMLSADVRSTDPALAGQVTPEDIGRTSRTGAAPMLPPATAPTVKANNRQDYALNKVDFSDPALGKSAIPSPPPAPPSEPSADLKKPSLVFVRSAQTKPTIQPQLPEQEERLVLPAGTRLVARLETPVSSAVPTPVVAVVEYNYEHNGQIVLPAGAKVFGRLAQVNSSGYVGIQFNRVEMPDGTVEKIDASAMDLKFGPLKGYVSGKKGGLKFLVRSLTGLGTVASYLVGPKGSNSTDLISTNTLMRERLADNIATAGQEELNGLAFNQNLVVTLPGNTRFYIVVQRPSSEREGVVPGTRSTGTNSASFGTDRLPTLEELRQLLQLKREINELYTQTSAQTAYQPPQQ